MYCKICGQENEGISLYCSNDGELLHINNSKVDLARENVNFCRECGGNISSNHLYCSECGISLYELEKSNLLSSQGVAGISGTNKAKVNDINIMDRISNRFNIGDGLISSIDIKGAVSRSIIALVIVFLVSLIFVSTVNNAVMESMFDGMDSFVQAKIVNTLDLALLSNLAKIKLGFDIFEQGNLNLAGVMPVFLLLPTMIFFIMGIFQGRKDNKLGKRFNFIDTLALGICYALILSLISIIGRKTFRFGGDILGINITIKKSYGFFATILNAGLISIISQILGYGTYAKLGKKDSIIGSFEWLFGTAFTIVASIVGISIMIFILTQLGLHRTGEWTSFEIIMNTPLKIFANMHFAIYVLLIASFGTFHFNFTAGEADFLDIIDSSIDQGPGVAASLIKGLDNIKALIGGKAVVFLYLAIFIPVILFFIRGMRAKKDDYSGIIKNIILPALTYSLILGIIAHLTNFKISSAMSKLAGLETIVGQPSTNIFIGFKFLSTLFGSFILTTLSSMAGFFLSKGKGLNGGAH